MLDLLGLISDAYAMGPAPQGGAQPGGAQGMLASLLPLILIFVVFYFLLIRPQQKKAKEHRQMLENIKKGDKVVTAGGVYGVVESVGPNAVVLKIAENVKVKFGKGYITAIRTESDED
ncbi:MAG: preprotein translocase subunit YajC [Alphaproteobacteria bacterium]|uniref:Sec translocon accessory complex subunit YajC n=1 Tax=Candidatus Nitrobium versatile TaxID=2884831 RepID=A0A953JC35_9BACT|nr:preprotein translocase subunit YajC [Candidatus Nitrobium versatile]